MYSSSDLISLYPCFAEIRVHSIVLGAQVIEKHFTLDRSEGGPDADFSLEPEEYNYLLQKQQLPGRALE